MNSLCRCVMLLLLGQLHGLARAADADAASDGSGATLVALVVPLLVVVIALAALWWMARRYGTRGSAAGPLRIVQVLGVGPRERVLVVEHDSRRFLLGVTQSTISLLADLDAEHAATDGRRATSSLVHNEALTKG
jgi:flagellar protein FliO/FliZ